MAQINKQCFFIKGKNTKKMKYIALTLTVALSANVYASEEINDAGPRNTAWRGGIATDDSGEIKLVAGGGFKNLYGNGEYQTQTIMLGEYYTQSENVRFR